MNTFDDIGVVESSWWAYQPVIKTVGKVTRCPNICDSNCRLKV